MTEQATPPLVSPCACSHAAAWFLLILTLQGQQQAVRMRVWRALRAVGAGVLRDGVYLLPKRLGMLEALQKQVAEINRAGGSAQILQLSASDAAQEREFRKLLDRGAEYAKLAHAVAAARAELESLDAPTCELRLARLRRDWQSIAALDYFPGAAAAQTQEALEDLSAAIAALHAPGEPRPADGGVTAVDPARYSGRIWATRERPWVDRLASAWLIRRFIDPDARFLWLSHPGDCPPEAVGFDFDDAEFTHVRAKVTFEVLLASFGLEGEPGLDRLAGLVHYLDVGGLPVPEAAGFEALLRGARARSTDDSALLLAACEAFDHLRAHFSQAP